MSGGVSGSSAPVGTPSASVTALTPTPVPPTESPATPAEGNACAGFEQWLSETRDRIQRARTLNDEAATLSDLDILTEHALAFEQLASDQAASAFPEAAGPVNKALVATFRAFGDGINQFVASPDAAGGTSLGQTDAVSTLDAASSRLTEIEQRLELVATGCASQFLNLDRDYANLHHAPVIKTRTAETMRYVRYTEGRAARWRDAVEHARGVAVLK